MQRLADSPRGRLVPIPAGIDAFVPHPLPRDMALSGPLVRLIADASEAVGILSGVGETMPNPRLLLRPLMRREATLSSRIEGTVSTLTDVLAYEEGRQARFTDDAQEVVNYVIALEHGIERLNELPISYRLVNELHAILMRGVRGQDMRPGEFRELQVYIGGAYSRIEDARYVPPPPHLLEGLFRDLEAFINDANSPLPTLVRCALIHYQFEAIHPYRDGNGRIGRLLISLFLQTVGSLKAPLLYLSAYFERDRERYYNELLNVSVTGDLERWAAYFLEGVTIEARDTVARIRRLRELLDELRGRLLSRRAPANDFRLLDVIFARPVITAQRAAEMLGVTSVGARRVLDRLIDAGIMRRDSRTRPGLYIADKVMEELERPISTESM